MRLICNFHLTIFTWLITPNNILTSSVIVPLLFRGIFSCNLPCLSIKIIAWFGSKRFYLIIIQIPLQLLFCNIFFSDNILKFNSHKKNYHDVDLFNYFSINELCLITELLLCTFFITKYYLAKNIIYLMRFTWFLSFHNFKELFTRNR